MNDVRAQRAVRLFADEPVVAVGRLDGSVADLGDRLVIGFAAEFHGFALARTAAHKKGAREDGCEEKFRLIHFLLSKSLVAQSQETRGVSPKSG